MSDVLGLRTAAQSRGAALRHRALAMGAAAVSWWLAELVGVVPNRVRALLDPDAEPVVLLADREGSVIASPDIRPPSMRGGRNAIVWLPPDQVLRREVRLPAAAERSLARALRYEVDRLSAFPAEEASFDYRVVAASRDEMQVAIVIASQELVRAAAASAEAAGYVHVRVGTAADGEHDSGYDLLRHERVARRQSSRLPAVLLLGLVLLGGATLAGVRHRHDAAVEELTRRIEVARQASREAEAQSTRLESARAALGFLPEKRRAPATVEIVDAISRVLPDDAWLVEVQVNRSEIRIAGFAPTSSRLIGLIESSRLFERVRFAAPVTAGPRPGLERFDIAMHLRATTAQ